jgi:hypothetical protein
MKEKTPAVWGRRGKVKGRRCRCRPKETVPQIRNRSLNREKAPAGVPEAFCSFALNNPTKMAIFIAQNCCHPVSSPCSELALQRKSTTLANESKENVAMMPVQIKSARQLSP